MDLDVEELKATKNKIISNKDNVVGYKTPNLEKLKIWQIIKDRIQEINEEEWDMKNEEEIKYWCKEELESILFRMIRWGE